MQNKKSKYFNTLFRKAHSKKGIMGKFWKVLYVLYSEYVLGCEIKWYTEIGTGFEIFHGARGSVISPTAIIGKNVSLRQNTTIGSKGFDGADNSPIIEDNVTIGPHVSLLCSTHPIVDIKLRNSEFEYVKKISIGNNVWIKGNVVILPWNKNWE